MPWLAVWQAPLTLHRSLEFPGHQSISNTLAALSQPPCAGPIGLTQTEANQMEMQIRIPDLNKVVSIASKYPL